MHQELESSGQLTSGRGLRHFSKGASQRNAPIEFCWMGNHCWSLSQPRKRWRSITFLWYQTGLHTLHSSILKNMFGSKGLRNYSFVVFFCPSTQPSIPTHQHTSKWIEFQILVCRNIGKAMDTSQTKSKKHIVLDFCFQFLDSPFGGNAFITSLDWLHFVGWWLGGLKKKNGRKRVGGWKVNTINPHEESFFVHPLRNPLVLGWERITQESGAWGWWLSSVEEKSGQGSGCIQWNQFGGFHGKENQDHLAEAWWPHWWLIFLLVP